MAGVSKDGKGYRIHFTINGKQKRLRMKGSRRNAERIARNIESLVLNKLSGEMFDAAAADWLASVGDDIYEKLRGFGLVNGRVVSGSQRLTDYVDRFVERCRTNDGKPAKPLTVKRWRTTAAYLRDCFGETVSLENFTVADANDFRHQLRKCDSKALSDCSDVLQCSDRRRIDH